VAIWLFAVAAIIVGMVTLGGSHRITGSAFDHRMGADRGAIPPLNDAQWHDAFAKYQLIRNTASKITA